MREILTIQVGGFANFIGSHFWNFQDELIGLAEEPHGDPIYTNQDLDMDVFYRSGETQQGIFTYTPRLLSIDIQGSLGSLSSHGSIYNEISSSDRSHVATWSGNVSRHVSVPHEKNLFLQSLAKDEVEKPVPSMDFTNEIEDKDLVECLQDDVKFWTDFSKVHYHPRSLYEVRGLFTDAQEFDNYGIGKDVFHEGLCGEEINERLRFFVEECDHIQGIQFIVDDSGGFSSIAADFLENIADEYTNTPVMLYSTHAPDSCMNPKSRKNSISRALHEAVSFSRLSSFCKLMVPLGLSSLSSSKASHFLCIEDAKPFHCSAVYAAALHSITIPFRMGLPGPTVDSKYVSGSMDVNEITTILSGQGRQNMVAILDVAMPAPPLKDVEKQRSILNSLHSLTPEVMEDVDLLAIEALTILGALHSGGRRAQISEVRDSVVSAYGSAVTRPIFSNLSVALCPLPIPLPFPSILKKSVGQYGELLDGPIPGPKTRGSLEVHSIPMAARLRSSNAILPFIEKRLVNLKRFGIERGAMGSELLRSWGFGKDELEDMGEGLSKMVMSLVPHSQESSDSD